MESLVVGLSHWIECYSDDLVDAVSAMNGELALIFAIGVLVGTAIAALGYYLGYRDGFHNGIGFWDRQIEQSRKASNLRGRKPST